MIYGILSTIIFFAILPFWLLLGVFKPKLIAGFKQKCGFFAHFEQKSDKNLVFYGVSVGEVIAMENLIKKTRETFENVNIIVLTGTATGQQTAKQKLGEVADFITFFPFDFPFCIQNMLKKLRPDAIFVMETELWPNFARLVRKKNIPLFIINGRISDRTYKSYKKLSFFFAPILKKYTNIFTQSAQDNEKLISIGANPYTTKIMGNLKFDIKKPDISSFDAQKPPESKVLLAGSTHSGEDELVLEAFSNLRKKIPNLKLIVAPRHPERNDAVFNLIEKSGFLAGKRSLGADLGQNDIILLDTMGELSKFYSVCDVAFLGGSFNKTGGHNPLEATIFDKPVLSGPSVHNFKDIYSMLTTAKAAFVVKSLQELEKICLHLLEDEAFYLETSKSCKDVFAQNGGALDFVINILQTIV